MSLSFVSRHTKIWFRFILFFNIFGNEKKCKQVVVQPDSIKYAKMKIATLSGKQRFGGTNCFLNTLRGRSPFLVVLTLKGTSLSNPELQQKLNFYLVQRRFGREFECDTGEQVFHAGEMGENSTSLQRFRMEFDLCFLKLIGLRLHRSAPSSLELPVRTWSCISPAI